MRKVIIESQVEEIFKSLTTLSPSDERALLDAIEEKVTTRKGRLQRSEEQLQDR